MKKLFFWVAVFSIAAFGQSNFKLTGNGGVWTDSLTTEYDTTGTSSGLNPSLSDSALIVDVGYAYKFLSVVIQDTGFAITDSIKVYKGSREWNDTRKVVDTLWCTLPLPFKDNGWVTDTTMVGAGQTKNYLLLEQNIDLLKILRVNAQIIQANKTKVQVEGKK